MAPRCALVLLLTLAACEANAPPAPRVEEEALAPRQLRRLTNRELDSVASGLVGHPLNLEKGLLREPASDVEALLVTDLKLDDFVATAQVVSRALAAGCADEACALERAHLVARRGYGRPLTDDERTRLTSLFRAGDDAADGTQLMLEAMLLSPHFIYRHELGSANGATWLTGVEIASAISFLFTGDRPDEPLLEAALSGKLVAPWERVAQGKRLMATDRGRLRIRALLLSWLDLEDMAQVSKHLEIYSFFTRPVREAMATELDRYLDDAAFGDDGTLAGLFTGSRGFPSALLAPFYGDTLKGPIVSDFAPVELDTTRRRGVLSLPGFLAHHSALDHTAPVERGLFVRAHLMCDEIAPPPAGIFGNLQREMPGPRTNRQRYAAHSDNLACVGCHKLMDPIGFGLENFDAVGRYQTTDNTLPIDATGKLEDTDVDGSFTGPAELGARLAESNQVRRCYALNLWREALGRPAPLPKKLAWARGAKLTRVLLDLVESESFIRRTGEAR